jgi:hypothetical protein
MERRGLCLLAKHSLYLHFLLGNIQAADRTLRRLLARPKSGWAFRAV